MQQLGMYRNQIVVNTDATGSGWISAGVSGSNWKRIMWWPFYRSACCWCACRGVARILQWCGAHKLSAEGRRGQGLGKGTPLPKSGARRELLRGIFGVFEAHRTLLVERTTVLRPNKASFFLKNLLNRRFGGMASLSPFSLRPSVHELAYKL